MLKVSIFPLSAICRMNFETVPTVEVCFSYYYILLECTFIVAIIDHTQCWNMTWILFFLFPMASLIYGLSHLWREKKQDTTLTEIRMFHEQMDKSH
jgi:hypothetical protein